MKIFRRLNVPNTFDPDDLRMRQILNIVLLALAIISFIALITTFTYGETPAELLRDSDSRLIVFGSACMLIICVTLIILNRSTRMPKGVVGWILVVMLTAVIAASDHPRELTTGRSVIFWFLPVLLSVVVLPPASVFVVDVIVFIFFALFGRSWEQLNIYAMFVIGFTSLLAWLGMSIAQRALRDARNEAEKNRAILNGVADGVVVLNSNDQVVLANPSALSMMGSAISRFTSILDYDRQEVGGRILSFHWSNVEGVGNVAIVRDISRQVEVERAKDAILGVVSHEMRTPLAAILGYSEVMLHTPEPSPELSERIRANAQRMISLVDDLLDHAQIQSGTLKMRKERFSPSSLANTVYELLSARANENGVVLNFHIAESLPAVLIGDSQRYQQILTNLVGNAIKFTNKDGRVDVSIAPARDASWQMIVKDTGIGIPPARLVDIFEPFRRASDYDTRKYQGAGLGLSIARKIAQLAGGDIGVTSSVGEGSTFTVTLPMRRPAEGVEGEIAG
jgi:signal transduction histidine kinase